MRKILYSFISLSIILIFFLIFFDKILINENFHRLLHHYILISNIIIFIICLFICIYLTYHFDIKRKRYFDIVCDNIHRIFELLPIGVFIIDDQYNIKFINDEAIKLLGFQNQSIPKKCTSFCKSICQLNKIDLSINFEHTLTNDQSIHLSTTIIPISFSEYKNLYIEFLYDISFRQKFLNKLIETCNFKSELISIISHEFRSPLHVIKLAVSSIMDGYSGDIDDEVRDDLKVSYSSVNRLISFVDELLDMSKIDNNKFEYYFEYSDICFIIQSVVDMSKYFLKNNNMKCIINCKPNLKINFDKQKMMQVFTNLMNNSIKFTEDGGIIVINVFKMSNFVVIEFIDNGRGIDNSIKDKIFDKFFYDSNVNLTGSGLGLYIVKSIISAHGGNIDFESPVKTKYRDIKFNNTRVGTKFIIRLPLNIIH